MHIYEKQPYSPAASAAAPPPPVAVKGFCYSLPSRRDHLSFAKMLRLPSIKWIAIYGLSWGPTQSPLQLSSAMCNLTLNRFQTSIALDVQDRSNSYFDHADERRKRRKHRWQRARHRSNPHQIPAMNRDPRWSWPSCKWPGRWRPYQTLKRRRNFWDDN